MLKGSRSPPKVVNGHSSSLRLRCSVLTVFVGYILGFSNPPTGAQKGPFLFINLWRSRKIPSPESFPITHHIPV